MLKNTLETPIDDPRPCPIIGDVHADSITRAQTVSRPDAFTATPPTWMLVSPVNKRSAIGVLRASTTMTTVVATATSGAFTSSERGFQRTCSTNATAIYKSAIPVAVRDRLSPIAKSHTHARNPLRR